MAVTDALPGVTVGLVADGRVLPEYADEEGNDDARTTTRHVEAVAGQTFSLAYRAGHNTPMLGDVLVFHVTVDGRMIDKKALRAPAKRSREATGTSEGHYLPGGMIQQYCFGLLSQEDDDRDDCTLSSSDSLQHLGTIRVDVHHKTRFAKSPRRESLRGVSHRALEPAVVDSVPEKALKGRAISHSVQLKTVSTGHRERSGPSDFLDPTRTPAATYLFHYRSRAALQSMFLLPRTPSPSAVLEPDIDTLSRDELIKLVKIKTASRARSDATVPVKREQEQSLPPRRRVRRGNQVTFIELDDNGEVVRETTAAGQVTPDFTAIAAVG